MDLCENYKRNLICVNMLDDSLHNTYQKKKKEKKGYT